MDYQLAAFLLPSNKRSLRKFISSQRTIIEMLFNKRLILNSCGIKSKADSRIKQLVNIRWWGASFGRASLLWAIKCYHDPHLASSNNIQKKQARCSEIFLRGATVNECKSGSSLNWSLANETHHFAHLLCYEANVAKHCMGRFKKTTELRCYKNDNCRS